MGNQKDQKALDTRMETKADSTDTRTAPADLPASHTPGPWRIAYAETEARWPVVAVDDDACPGYDNEIAEIGGIVATRGREGNWLPDPAADTVMANARLIAAAPDLLAALKDVTDWLADQRDFQLGNGDPGEYLAVDAARAAIAKAEGRD